MPVLVGSVADSSLEESTSDKERVRRSRAIALSDVEAGLS